MTLLLLNDASADADATLATASDLRERLSGHDPPVRVVTATAAFRAYEESVGGLIRGYRWNDWALHAARTFDGFIRSENDRLGKANANIVEHALRFHKPVLFMSADNAPRSVLAVLALDAEDYVGGWALAVGGNP